jgi:hypothetical protein
MTIPDLSKLRDHEYPKIAERFYRDTEHHELTVLQDNGLYRHLRMMPPKSKSSCYWYDVVTWPHNLVFRGDGETFAFSRVEDMLAFFRSGLYKDGSIHINATYWAEKLTTNRECVNTYDDEKFKAYVGEMIAESEEEYPGLTKAWEEATEGFCADYDLEHEQGAWEALNNFEYGQRYIGTCSCGQRFEGEHRYDVGDWARKGGHKDSIGADKPGHHCKITVKEAFTFDPSDMGSAFKDYDWWFLWSLYGIVKAIAAYDRHKGNGMAMDVAEAGSVVLV